MQNPACNLESGRGGAGAFKVDFGSLKSGRPTAMEFAHDLLDRFSAKTNIHSATRDGDAMRLLRDPRVPL